MSKKKKKLEMVRKQVYFPRDDWSEAERLSEGEGASFMVRKWTREGIKREKKTQ